MKWHFCINWFIVVRNYLIFKIWKRNNQRKIILLTYSSSTIWQNKFIEQTQNILLSKKSSWFELFRILEEYNPQIHRLGLYTHYKYDTSRLSFVVARNDICFNIWQITSFKICSNDIISSRLFNECLDIKHENTFVQYSFSSNW